jgi:signal transduction histidine kinase
MDANQLARLFTRFDRGWARQSNIPGTGLGLALVKDLIQAYGGNIHVTSVLNEGSTFTFWLPVTNREEAIS